MPKKHNTKGKGTRKDAQPTRVERQAAREIAAHLSAVLHNPRTPGEIYNHVHEGLCELYTPREIIDSPLYIEQQLIGEFIETKRKGGAR